MVSCGVVALTVGEQPPAMSISWAPPSAPVDSGYIIFFADLFPGDPGFDDLPRQPVCLACLVEGGDEQLGRGLDLARELGHVDWDPDAGEWFVPLDAGAARDGAADVLEGERKGAE